MSILDPKPPTRAELTATFVPKWKPATAYAAGEPVVNPSGDVVTAKVAFTSGAAYSAANWNASTTYASAASVAGKLDATTAADTYATKDVPAIPISAGTKGKLITYGHSFLAEQGLTDDTKYWARRLAASLGLTYPTSDGGTANDLKRAIGGTSVRSASSAQVIGSATANFVAGTKALVVIQALINSSRLHGAVAGDLTTAANALRSMLAAISASERRENNHASLTYTGSWQSASSTDTSGGTWQYTSVTNDYVQIVTPAQPCYILFIGKNSANGPVVTVTDQTNAGAAVGSFDLSNQSVSDFTFVHYAYKVPTALQGNTLRFQKTGGSTSFNVDVALPQSATPPPVLMMKEPYLANYAASTSYPNGSDAATDAFNNLIDTMAAEFPNVIVADPNKAGYWDKNKHTQADQVHPNEAGNAALARAAYDAVRAWQTRKALGLV